MYTKVLVISILILQLLGCHNNKQNDKNVFVSDVLLQTGQPMPIEHGDQFTVKYTLNVKNIVDEDVEIHFYMGSALLTTDDVGNNSVDLTNVHFLKSIIQTVSTGTYPTSIDLIVPNIVGVAGEYKVVAIVDPNNKLKESNENDNWLTRDMIDSMSDEEREIALMETIFSSNTILVAKPPINDITIDDFNVSQTEIIFDTPVNVSESKLKSHLVGYIEARDSAQSMSDIVLQAEVLIDGTWQLLSLWNEDPESSGGEYKPTLLYQFDRDYNQAHLGFDVFFPEESQQTLYDNYEPSTQNILTIRFTLAPAQSEGIIDSQPDNNMVTVTLPYYFFEGEDEEPTSSLKSSFAGIQPNSAQKPIVLLDKSFNQTYGNPEKIAAGIKLGGGVEIDPNLVGGTIFSSGSLNVHFFKFQQDIAEAKFNVNAYLSGKTSYSLEMLFLNTTVFSTKGPESLVIEPNTNENELVPWTVSPVKQFERSRVIAESIFFVGPVQLTVSGGVTGNAGFNVTAGYNEQNQQLFIEGDVFIANFKGYAKGGIDSSLVTADINIDMDIADNNLNVMSSLGFISANNASSKISYKVLIIDKLKAIEGTFDLTAQIAGIKWCKVWIIPYPCGTQKNTYDVNLYKTKRLFEKEFQLYTTEGEINL